MILAIGCWSCGKANGLCVIHKKTGVVTCRGCRTQPSILWRWKFVFGSIDTIWHKGLSLTLNWQKQKNNKKIYPWFTSLLPENISKVQGLTGPTRPQKAFTLWQWHLTLTRSILYTCVLAQDLRLSRKNLQPRVLNTIKLDLGGRQGCSALWICCAAGTGDRLLCTKPGQWWQTGM